MRSLLLSSLLFLFFSCAPKIHQEFREINNEAVLTPVFDASKSYLYKAKIDILKYYLSGLLFMKPITKDTFRLVFTNELGIKFFDIEFFPKGKTVHYIMDKMNKKAVINTLEKDMKLFLMSDLEMPKAQKLKSEHQATVFKFAGDKENYFYFLNDSSVVNRIELTSKKKVKVDVSLKDYQEGVPHFINIKHHNFKFNIELNYLQR
jgi:hypothetical protein